MKLKKKLINYQISNELERARCRDFPLRRGWLASENRVLVGNLHRKWSHIRSVSRSFVSGLLSEHQLYTLFCSLLSDTLCWFLCLPISGILALPFAAIKQCNQFPSLLISIRFSTICQRIQCMNWVLVYVVFSGLKGKMWSKLEGTIMRSTEMKMIEYRLRD